MFSRHCLQAVPKYVFVYNTWWKEESVGTVGVSWSPYTAVNFHNSMYSVCDWKNFKLEDSAEVTGF